MKVKNIGIREIFATNAEKTVEMDIETSKGTIRSSVPIGTSKGKYEVNYLPTDVVLRKFQLFKRHFMNEDFSDIKDVDDSIRMVDKTDNFRDIGGNLALVISTAFLKAFALESGQDVFEYVAGMRKEKPSIPRPICNIIGGGKHAGRLDIQEFHLLPVHQTTFLDSMTKISAAYLEVGKMLKRDDPTFSFAKNIESAWTSNLDMDEIFRMMTKAANDHLLKLGVDIAASSLWDGSHYVYRYANKILSSHEQIAFVRQIAKKYPLLFIEDPLHEDDFEGFSILTHELQPRIITGDDLYATNLKRLKDGLDFKSTNGIIIKPNQVGTITDVMKVVEEAKKNNMITILSHRSGETEDTMMCHLAVGLGCDYVKLGIAGERTVKINEIIRIEEKIKP